MFDEPSAASELGRDILFWLNRITGLRNRGIVERPGLYVLRKTRMPAVLVEMGFISNKADNALFEDNKEEYARLIAEAILTYLDIDLGDKKNNE